MEHCDRGATLGFPLWGVMDKATAHTQGFVWTQPLILLGKCLQVKLLGQTGSTDWRLLSADLEKTTKFLSKTSASFCTPTGKVGGLELPRFLLFGKHSNRCRLVSHRSFYLHFSNGSPSQEAGWGMYFTCSAAICVSERVDSNLLQVFRLTILRTHGTEF